MPTKDDFTPDNPLPVFLSERAEKTEQPVIGKAWDRAVVSSRILKTSILVVTATAIGIAILSVGNPIALFANVTASLVDKSALQPGTDQSAPTIQSIAGTQDLPPTEREAPPVNPGANPESAPPSDDKTAATDAPTRDEIAAASEPAGQSQMENSEPPSEALFKQFQAWAAEKDTRAKVGPVQPVQTAPAQVVQDARPEVRPMKKHRHVRAVQNARAEIRSQRHPRAKVRREQNARVQVRPVQDARAQDQSVQNAQAPLFLQSLGWPGGISAQPPLEQTGPRMIRE
jgi:hypothetical protein